MQAAQRGDLALVNLFLRAPKRVTEPCVTRSLLLAADNGWLPVVLCLVQAGADGDNENASALMHAAQMGNTGIATAIIMGRNPPSPVSVNRILDRVFSSPPEFINGNQELIEVLLCGGPLGNAVHEGIIKATKLANVGIIQLLLAHNADINYNGAAAVAHAVRQNRGDLLGLLLQGQKLKQEIASELVCLIPTAASSTDKVIILSKLLVNGASGRRCSELLILAAERDDLDTARLLITARDQTGRPVCSTDHDSARCLEIVVSKGYIPMLKILLDGAPSKPSLSAAFSSIPTNLSREIHFSLVQTLLRAGVEGPAVDEALVSAVSDEPKSRELIELLIRNGAVVADQTLYATASQGLVTILEILLMGKVSARSCSIAVPMAMNIRSLQARYHTIRLLLGPSTKSDAGSSEVTQAVIELLQHYPEDKKLLLLLCRDGRANINLLGGLALELAARNGDLETFNIVLQDTGALPNPTTVEKAIKCAMELQLTDFNRKDKVKFLLEKVKPQKAMDEALVLEIKLVLASPNPNLSVVKILLAAGADINAIDGEAVVWGIRDPAIADLLLSKNLNPQSFSKAFFYAVGLDEPARYSLCEKLLKAGPPKDPVSIALSTVIKEGQSAIPLIELLLPQSDVNFNDGRAMLAVVEQAFVDGLDILLTPRDVMPSTATKVTAFQTAIQLKNNSDRYAIAIRLLKSGVPKNIISEALVSAVNTSDIQLTETLLRSGASIEHLRGQAVLCAASSGQGDILRLLIEGRLSNKPSMPTFISAFGGALTLKQKDPKSCHLIVQILLEAGVRGDAVNAALVEIARDGDINFGISELLCTIGEASVEWNDGEALDIAAQSSSVQTLRLLLEQKPSQSVLARAYKSASYLPKDKRYQVVQYLLEAGKSIDKQVSGSLTYATKEAPTDRQLVKLLLDHKAFDEGESITNSARALDAETLKLLLGSPKAIAHISSAFKEVIATGFNWRSHEGLSIVKLLLESGANGEIVGEALANAVQDLEDSPGQLANEFVDVLLHYGADVNYQQGLALQRAAMQANIDLLKKLLPGATIDSKAISIPYIFKTCSEPTTLVRAIQAFNDSLDGDDRIFITGFAHPDLRLEPVLFMALERCPKRHQVLKALLDLGYNPNQWIPRGVSPTMVSEPWPILCWALEQPEKAISNMNIELLIDAGGEFSLLMCLGRLLIIAANVNFRSKSGLTPLMLAIRSHRSEIVSKLLSKFADVKVTDQNGITPLSMASHLGNTTIMEHLLQAGAECDDGSLHDAARELRCDIMRVLMKFDHKPDYPSDRHNGRSALAELCLSAVNRRPVPTPILLEEAIQCLIAGGANIRLRILAENTSEKTLFHFALDSLDPMLILPVLLKIMWEYVNEECFFYEDATYTYSLTKYVDKDLYQGPADQKESIIRSLKNKRVVDRFWATDVDAEQPDDCCGAPEYIKNEAIRQKLRRKQKAEQHQDAMAALELKRQTALRNVEIMEITKAAEIRAEREKAHASMQVLEERAEAQMRLDSRAETERMRLLDQRHTREAEHLRAQAAIQLSTQRALKQEGFEAERMRNALQIEHMEAKIRHETDGRRAILAIENQSREDQEKYDKRLHEREMARVKMQKSLVENSTRLASSLQGTGMTQRQIGYITGEVP